MDGFSRDELRKFQQVDSLLGVPSTCFFLRYQIAEAADIVRVLAQTGYDVELHSEARPVWTTSAVPLLWLVETSYRRKLRRQVGWMRRRRFEPWGHSPHSVHNYLGFQNWIDWNVIEQATIGTGLRYVSDWRIIARTPEGASGFPEPLPPFFRSLDSQGVLVIPTSWDDKFFFASYEDRAIRRRADSAYLGRTMEEALASADCQMVRCLEAGIPVVINLHPIHAVRGELPLFQLKERLVELAQKRGIPVMSLRGLYQRLISDVSRTHLE